ncbi:c-type cytochrome [Hymenobacter perfusus]|uniref:Cytochrome c n=1 Tax=Hymenobacter perfusus TaxID=1236770 RepID=A0A428KIF2_9BACT|nr:cytochrome c [Hymenobacter perfusus]RSK46247.1 cytochrome c [Hymenobacter perfusus]
MSAPVLLLSLHVLLVCAAFLFFGYKVWLLLTGRQEPLRQLRARTRWADSVLLGTTLLSGASVWATTTALGPGFLALLVGVVVLLLACVWMLRRESGYLAFGNLLGAVVLYISTLYLTLPNVLPNQLRQPETTAPSASGQAEATATPDAAAPVDTLAISATDQALLNSVQTEATAPPVLEVGKVLYTQNCVVCHGSDGKLGLNGARDLTQSNLNAAGRMYQVANGSISKKMPAFQDKLTEEEIRQVVEYSLTLR